MFQDFREKIMDANKDFTQRSDMTLTFDIETWLKVPLHLNALCRWSLRHIAQREEKIIWHLQGFYKICNDLEQTIRNLVLIHHTFPKHILWVRHRPDSVKWRENNIALDKWWRMDRQTNTQIYPHREPSKLGYNERNLPQMNFPFCSTQNRS